MGISRLMVPAVTLAGALALAACGGNDTPPSNNNNQLSGPGPNGAFTNADCVRINGAGSEATSNGKMCTLSTAQTSSSAFAEAGGTPGALLDSDGNLNVNVNSSGDPQMASKSAFEALKDKDRIDGLHGSENPGMKWDVALGATDTKLGGGTGKAVKATGKKLSDFSAGGNPPTVADFTKNTAVTGATYKGVAGSLICTGDDCNTPADGTKTFAGSWYFFATGPSASGLLVKDGEKYVLRSDKPSADWGVWLTDVQGGPGKVIQWYRNAGPAPTGTAFDDKSGAGAINTAKYTGDAVGVSTMYESSKDAGDAKVGSFTAKAELEATFSDTAPMLKGMIKEFDGDAVNTGWELELMPSGITSGAVQGDTKANRATLADAWNAQFYGTGTADDRPAGVVGDFDGRFGDGQAVGVFHAK